MVVHWKVVDGFNNRGPHSTSINEEDLEGLKGENRERMIRELVSEDFNQIVTFSITRIEE